jgi:hypothetical protein
MPNGSQPNGSQTSFKRVEESEPAASDSLPRVVGLESEGTKHIPMFEVPQDPVGDVELGDANGGG